MDAYLHLKMLEIRTFEEKLLALFAEGKLFGTTHSYIGQEAIALAVVDNLERADVVVSNHRCHGHYLAKTGDMVGLLAEIMGKEGGVCGGKGGSQHLKAGDFMSNGVQGNMFPVAAGYAYANKLDGRESLVVVFVGDGTMGQGVVYETMNLISLLEVPILVVVENNQYAQTTPAALNLSGSIKKRAEAFDLSCNEQDVADPVQLYEYFAQNIADWKRTRTPHVEILNTYRLGPHSKGDDFREAGELELWRARDPLCLLEARMEPETVAANRLEVQDKLDAVVDEVARMDLASAL